MKGTDSERTEAGFKVRTPIDEARQVLRAAIEQAEDELPATGTERVELDRADGRVLAAPLESARNVPHYRRAAMDGYAVRAEDTFGASERSPEILRTVGSAEDDGTTVDPGTAARVHTGSALPDGADAVVMIERVSELEATGELEVEDAVAEGENVAPTGEDVDAGQQLYDAGHRLRPSDLGLLRSVGYAQVEVTERPTVGVVPTGEELVDSDPGPGEVIETNGLTVSRLVERWGGDATYRDVVTDDHESLRVAIQRDLTKDVVVTTGGSSVGERDLLPEVIDDLGEVLVHGVGLKPGHPVCLGIVEETPVLALPGYPVACIVNAVQFLRPTLRWLAGTTPDPHPTTRAVLERKIPSEPGTRTFARVQLDERDAVDDEPEYAATPTRASGSGVLSSVALADGWVVVDDDREGIPEGEPVAVQDWEVNP
ncbi:molybdopterin molybdotransferase MoeA [Natronobacterium gregoryi]|uniref:Molybdenum cofactor synthesis domain protein n=2 Tax=Natronobacterium gregoryi TaxID=44930 RepID=L0AMC0_NATGS|nr:gephyrin-like molybdotransferase Glp [Natronobacterium gregoryi]AFZ74337.1 molybdenum cofactor synthesis domain protein [Natronobacterium gregoryi SP2]ELY63433.1 molybdenum cofactor synthesis protein [Natronobacterium gregoryi SP2]PLK22153.1 molybdopterin molybdenumtransferase MoeA [Natronobacterium gregoryi SP2]SFI53993.1 molybdopterin molybdochelatase [Natronobacterium gregoryi]